MLAKFLAALILFGGPMFAQQVHLLTNAVGEWQEIIADKNGVKLIRLKEGSDGMIILSNAHKVNYKRTDPRISQLTKDISIDKDITVNNRKIYYKNSLIGLYRKVRIVKQTVNWNGWVICVVWFTDPTIASAPDVITSDLVFFKPDTLKAKIIFTGLPALELQVYIE